MPAVVDGPPSDCLSREERRRLCLPVGSVRIYRDESNVRWFSYVFEKSMSRSCAIHGDFRSPSPVVNWMWN
eukprot:2831989-Lingulodinium_polyedra.AAC.1